MFIFGGLIKLIVIITSPPTPEPVIAFNNPVNIIYETPVHPPAKDISFSSGVA